MASTPTFISGLANSPGLGEGRSDTPAAEAPQGYSGARRRTRPRTLVVLRAAYVVGQIAILLVTWRMLHWRFPLAVCLGLVGAASGLNLSLALASTTRREVTAWEVNAQLVFDVVELAALLYFTGGVLNPFSLLLIAPVTVAGGALPPWRAAGICALTVAATLALAVLAPPVVVMGVASGPGATGYRGDLPGSTIALVVASVFAGGYAIWSSVEEARMELALHVTETVLAREQRLSALGALAAAVAHELGTPLATIAIIATEMAREAPLGPLREDAVLMVQQARRCREILKRLAEAPEQPDALHERMGMLQLVREIIEPFAGAAGAAAAVRVEALVTGPPGMAAPDIWRRPEILLAISTIVENAVDFARREILLTARFDEASITVEVRDDGPGFSPAILPRLGDPYVTSRPGGEGASPGRVGLGLGLFVSKTLLDRSGAQVSFANGPRGGAIVTARWPRRRLEITAAEPPHGEGSGEVLAPARK